VYKITTFVPQDKVDCLLEGVLKVTPLLYGRYDQVAWFSAPGTEQFRPQAGSNPTLGQSDITERGMSVKLEFAIPRSEQLLHRVLKEGIAAYHPWEEPVIYITESLATRMHVDEEE